MTLGGQMWRAVLSVILAYEAWATVTRHQTMSEAVWSWGAIHPWITSLTVVGGLTLLAVHLVYPIWVRRRRVNGGA